MPESVKQARGNGCKLNSHSPLARPCLRVSKDHQSAGGECHHTLGTWEAAVCWLRLRQDSQLRLVAALQGPPELWSYASSST